MAWLRLGNFYRFDYRLRKRHVTFQNFNYWHQGFMLVTIKEIEIEYIEHIDFNFNSDNTFGITITKSSEAKITIKSSPLPASIDALQQAYKQFFSESECKASINIYGDPFSDIYEIKTPTNIPLKKLLELFEHLNKKFKREEFSADIITELSQIFNFIENPEENSYQHKIPKKIEHPLFIPCVDPKKANSIELINVFERNKKENNSIDSLIKTFKNLLPKGFDVTVRDRDGLGLLEYVIRGDFIGDEDGKGSDKLVELFIYVGVDPVKTVGPHLI